MIGEFLPGFETISFAGLAAPKEIVRIINREVNAGLADATLRRTHPRSRRDPAAGLAGRVRKLLADETEKWMKVVKFSGAKAS